MFSKKSKKATRPLADIARKAVLLDPSSCVVPAQGQHSQAVPFILQPGTDFVHLGEWLHFQGDLWESWLNQYGALLFRGFPLETQADFSKLFTQSQQICLSYSYDSTPRSQLGENIYTSTEYPAEAFIPQHNEMAYAASWPLRLWFFCQTPADSGGQTPLSNSHAVYRAIDPAIRETFEEKGLLYSRNYSPHLDIPWQKVFGTEKKAQVEHYCQANGLTCHWRGDGTLHTTQKLPAVRHHRQTGQKVWFNQAHLFHISGLPENIQRTLKAELDPWHFPRHCFFGDGSAIPESSLDHIRGVYLENTITWTWQKGDLLVIDNMAMGHGRLGFQGARKILVAMTDQATSDASVEGGVYGT